jgi:hypothetical protein
MDQMTTDVVTRDAISKEFLLILDKARITRGATKA